MADREEIYSIEAIRERLSLLFQEEGLQLVLLFGSVVHKRIHKKSDIDLAFLFDKPIDILLLTNQVTRLLRRGRVDVVDLRYASPLLRFSVVREGKLLYERTPGLFSTFCSLVFRRYVDTKKIRDAQGEVIKHFLEEKGIG